MATASLFSRAATLHPAVRQFSQAVALAFAAIGFGCLICLGEKSVVSGRRFAENPADLMMRGFGLAHFLVGWLFLFTSPRMLQPAALGRLSICTVLGLLLCLGFAYGGGTKNPLLLMLFYGYFLIHEVRDQANFYQSIGNRATPTPESARFVRWLSAAVGVLLIALLAGGFLLRGNAAERADRLPLSLSDANGLVVCLIAVALGLGAQALRLGVNAYGSLLALFAVHRPLLQVFAGLFVLLALGSLLGTMGLDLVILVHVCTWLVFVRAQLASSALPRNGNPWTWLRRTPTGFLTLHLGLVAVLLVLMGCRVHAWERTGWLSAALATSSFPYWGLMHISMAWWRGK